ncbi:MAG: 16S rRNA (guanine(527)-N(7))-methyltransferase RsmG, partial [Desulfobulbaceae bacterium]
MTPEDFGQILSAGVDEFGISLSSNSLSTLHCYYQELQKWSRKVNLIARGTSAAEIVEKHFLDSLALLQSLDSERDNVVDIGSGAGFPGLVCKAGNPL